MSSRPAADGILLVVAAPSGAGKTSLMNALIEGDPDLVLSVSYTTRPGRPGEEDGQHYHFIEDPEFARLLEQGAFLEYAEVFGHLYGTHAETTRDLLANGQDVILEIDWQGARQVRESFPACHGIFILPPSLAALRSRLGQRAQDSEAVIRDRMDKARAEISHCEEFDYVVINDDFGQALSDLREIVDCARRGLPYESAPHKELLAELLENR